MTQAVVGGSGGSSHGGATPAIGAPAILDICSAKTVSRAHLRLGGPLGLPPAH